MLLRRIPSPHKSMQLTFGPGMFAHIDEGSLLMVDNHLLETLRDAVVRAVDDSSFLRCGITLLVGEEVLGSTNALTQMNLILRSIWASTTIVVKPWTGGIPRTSDGKFSTASILQIAERNQALLRLPKLLKTQGWLLSVHRSGRTVRNGPSAPSSPNKALMMSTEVCTYLWAVAGQARPRTQVTSGSLDTAPATLKRLQPKKRKNSFKGSIGRGRSRGGQGSRGGGGSSGRGGRGGRGGSSCGRGPTFINSGIHYHKW